MKRPLNRLRFVRIALELAFCAILCCAIFAGTPSIGKLFLTQVGSDLMAVIANFSAVAVIFLVGILVFTCFFGRAYCSTICPLGLLQDIMGLFHHGQFRYISWKRFVREPLFCLVIGLFIFGFMLPLTLLMPSANFLIIVQYGLQSLVHLLQQHFQNLPELQTIRIMPHVQLTAWALFCLLLAASIWNGRLFCNVLCPVGALLARCAKHARYRITIDADKCVSCGACEHVCKPTCIDSKRKLVANDECVLCMNCLSACHKGAISYKKSQGNVMPFQKERRLFISNFTTLAAGLSVGQSIKLLANTSDRRPPIMPPGAGDINRFNSRCVGCGACIAVCKGKALKPAMTEYGLRGFLQPVVDPYRGPCEFTCNQCSQVCPCGAISPLTIEKKQRTRIGIAHWIRERCVAYKDGQACGACAEHCPVGALEMIPYNDITVPKVNTDLCIGCGACQNICPIRPDAAIVVEGLAQQINVIPPKHEKQEKLSSEEEFPF